MLNKFWLSLSLFGFRIGQPQKECDDKTYDDVMKCGYDDIDNKDGKMTLKTKNL